MVSTLEDTPAADTAAGVSAYLVRPLRGAPRGTADPQAVAHVPDWSKARNTSRTTSIRNTDGATKTKAPQLVEL
jgi:hypothetical protein